MKDLPTEPSDIEPLKTTVGKESITENLSKSAHDAIDRASEKAAAAEDTIRASAQRAEAQANALAGSVDQKRKDTLEAVQDYARKHPLESLGIAFASGIVFSSLMRR